MSKIVINTRVLDYHTTGVQRYLTDVMAEMPVPADTVAPQKSRHGVKGHLWEQFWLPNLVGDRLLWSPSNSGPLITRRQVVTIHDVVPLDHPEWLSPKFASWYRFLLPRLAKRAQHIIVVSDFTKRRLMHHVGISDEKITTIWCGVNNNFTIQSPGSVSRAATSLGLPKGRYILSVGSLEPRKNLGRLLKAWSKILPLLPGDVSLVLTGAKGKKLIFKDVPELDSLPPRVYLAGYASDESLPALYSGALAFAYLSVYEGFGLPPLEAMACGVPCIVGNLASIPEVVGDAALKVDPYDVNAIAQGLYRLVTESPYRDHLRGLGLARVKGFSWERAAKETLSVLTAAAEKRS